MRGGGCFHLGQFRFGLGKLIGQCRGAAAEPLDLTRYTLALRPSPLCLG